MKRLAAKTQPGTEIAVDIREDAGGSPGGIIATSKRPINATTMTENWINFDFDPAPELQEGRYWIAVRIVQTEDVDLISDMVNIHYVPNDKQADGNDRTRQMLLSVNLKDGVATETSWAPLSYDRDYSIVLTKK